MTTLATTSTTANLILDHFDAIAEVPGGVARLRQLILQLAVQGRLVAQDPGDEPASVLLGRIREKRKSLLESGWPNPEESRTQVKKLTEQIVPGGLEALPAGWSWATLTQCSAIVVDCKNKTAPYANQGIKIVRTTNIRNGKLNSIDQKYVDEETYQIWSARYKPQPGDILITREAPMGEVCLIPEGEQICLGQRVMLARVFPEMIDPNFMIYSLRDPRLMDRVQDKPIGITVQHLRVGGVESLLIPLPPLAEQRRIVARVDALMALCDALEERQARQGEERRRLLTALVDALLGARDAGEAAAAWARLSESFDLVLAAPEDVAPLRQAVLQLAVQGRLVEQDPQDEPASALLERIRVEKARLVKEGKLKKSEPLAPITAQESDDLRGWALERFGEIADIVSGVTKGRALTGRDVRQLPYLRVANVQRGYLDLTVVKEIEVPVNEIEKYRLLPNDLLLTEGGDWDKLGRTALWNGELCDCIHQNHVFRARLFTDDILPSWVMMFTNSSLGRAYFESSSKQTTNLASINMNQLRNCPLPLPPLAEQRRIVARVEQQMVLCDALEARLREERAAAEQLAEALCAAVAAGRPAERAEVAVGAGAPAVLELPRQVPALDLDAYAIFAARVVQQHQGTPTARTLGHVKLEKIAHLAEPYAGVDLGRRPWAMPRGPADFDLLRQVIERGRELNAFDAPAREGSEWGYQFIALQELDALAGRLDEVFGAQAARLNRLVELLVPLKSRQAEAVATLYAVWNNLLRAGERPDDEQIFAAFRTFHPKKERFQPAVLVRWLGWMREHGIVPDGSARPTLPANQRGVTTAHEVAAAAPAALAGPARPTAKMPVTYDTDDSYVAAAALLAEHGALTNGDLQAALGLDGASARALLKRLVAEGLARQEGERRGARYVWTGRQRETVS